MRSGLGLVVGVSLLCSGAAFAQEPPKAPLAASLSNPQNNAASQATMMRSGAKPATVFGRFSSEVAVAAITRVCAAGQGVAAAADSFGLPVADAPASVRAALPGDARLWRVESTDSAVMLYVYGSGPEHCGAVISRPLAGATSAGIQTAMTEPAQGYVVENKQDQGGGNQFVRFRSKAGRFVDLVELAAKGDAPGLIKLELLP